MLEKKHIMLCRMIPTDSSQETEDYWQQQVEDYAWQLQSYWQYYNRHHWDYQVRGYVIRYDGLCDPPSVVYGKGWAEDATDEYIATHDMQGFEPNYRYVWGKTSKNYCGLAVVGGDRAMINGVQTPSTCGAGTMVHEGGHNYGYRHTGFLREDGTTTEYGDKTCVMGGGGSVLKGLCSPNMVILNLDTARERIVIEESKQILMCPTEMPYHGMHPDEYQHVVLRRRRENDIYISLRKVRGTRFPVHKSYEGRLFAHMVMPDKSIKRIDPDMKIGDAPWTLPNGFVVDYHEFNNETARVSFITDLNPQPPLAMPTGFPAPLPSSRLLPKFNGAWFNRDFDGQGLDVHIRGDDAEQDMVVYWYTANEYDDQLRYYIGYMSKGTGIRSFNMYTTKGGTWDNPTTLERIDVGEGMIEFYDEKRAVFHYNFPDLFDRGSIELVPVAPLTTHELNGSWYMPELDGSGFTVQVFPTGQISMFWFTFDKNGNQLWFTCQGHYVNSTGGAFTDMPLADTTHGIYELKIYEVKGLNWMYFTEIDTVPVGNATATFYTDQATEKIKCQFDYSIESDFVTDSGVQYLNKLL